jgi:hypothetical protein
MKLLARTARDLRRLGSPGGGFTLLVLAVALALEVLGRQSDSDLQDLLAASTLSLVGMLVAARHRQTSLPWVGGAVALGRRAKDFLYRNTFEIGLDLRGTPKVKRGTPPAILALAGVLLAWAGLLAFTAADAPYSLRAVATRGFYLGYLLALIAVWGLLLAAVSLSVLLPAAMIHDACVAAHAGPGRRSRRTEYFALVAYFGGLVLAHVVLPSAFMPIACLVTLAVYLTAAALSPHADVQFLWRPRGTIRVRAITWGRWVAWEFTLITLAVLDLALTAGGHRLITGGGPQGPDTMPVTTMLGAFLTCLAPGILAALTVQTLLGRWRDPARAVQPVLYVGGERIEEHRAAIERAFRGCGWRVRFAPAEPGPLDVCVELTDRPLPVEVAEPSWPLGVRPDDLIDSAGLFERLKRRDEIQKRRRLTSGLEHLFKLAAGRPKRSGGGFWVAPHFWFVPGLMRDTPRDQADEEFDLRDDAVLSGAIGPPYHRELPREARNHLHAMLRALQVDLIFVEDGVTFKRFRKVLRALFEVYDVHAGQRPAEELHFLGLPGTKVVIHEFQFDEPFKSEVFPEPKYDYLGRARLLHVFRDRGGQEEYLEPPFDFSRSPAPAAMW